MKVSVITSCRNRESTIRNSIESVLRQDYPNVEYVVVDGNSSDNTLDIINEYADRIANIVSEPDKCMYEGINKGLRRSTGDIIGLLHSDDVFYSANTISNIVEEFERTGADFMYGNGIFIKGGAADTIVRDWISGEYTKKKVSSGWLPLHTTVFVKREVLDKIGLYDESFRISADTDWMLRCLYKNNLKVAYLREYVVIMQMGGASTSFRLMRKKWQEDLRAFKRNDLPQYLSLTFKILSKIPQFVKAKIKNTLRLYK